jgi:hypothetical protein
MNSVGLVRARMAVTRTSKMLRAARKAGLVKLQRRIGCVDHEGPFTHGKR